jgi:pimeloyl-ACP methyl ester carboxylesterase
MTATVHGQAQELSGAKPRESRIRMPSGVASTVVSRDGTRIAFSRVGRGSPVILVDGALCHRTMGPAEPLARLLAPHFTVYTYDRRGRGASGDTPPYAVERELEDIEALVVEAGGSVGLWGSSSGGILALDAANHLEGIRKVALFEAPFIVDDTRPTTVEDWVLIRAAVAAGRPSDAVKIFLTSVGVPPFIVAVMRLTPVWSKLKGVAHTLPYDSDIAQKYQTGQPLPAGSWASVTMPTLVMDGGKSPAWIRHANRSLASILPNAQYRTLDGQTHMVKAKAHAPALVAFFNGSDSDPCCWTTYPGGTRSWE